MDSDGDRTDHVEKILRLLDDVLGPDDGAPVPDRIALFNEAPFFFFQDRPIYFDRQGRPLPREEAVLLFEDVEARRVAADELGGVRVSTVHLVINHQYGSGPPLIFETMIFGGDHDGEEWRYPTEEDAREGHRRVVAWLRGEGGEP